MSVTHGSEAWRKATLLGLDGVSLVFKDPFVRPRDVLDRKVVFRIVSGQVNGLGNHEIAMTHLGIVLHYSRIDSTDLNQVNGFVRECFEAIGKKPTDRDVCDWAETAVRACGSMTTNSPHHLQGQA